jgi:long-subunit fatty acid transport protein
MALEVKQSSVYGYTFGVSYAINDAWSLAVGTRYATGTREFDGFSNISETGLNERNLKIHLEEEADGWAGILGINFAPNKRLNTALTFISNTKMEYKMEIKEDTTLFPDGTPDGLLLSEAMGFPNGSKRRIDVPGLLGFGVSYRFLPELKVDLNYTYYLEEDAEIDTYGDEGNSWDLGIAAEYSFNPEWKASLGYMLTNVKIDDDQQINEPEEPKFDAHAIGVGVVWSPTPRWAVTLAGLYVLYDTIEDDNGIEYGKTVYNASIGIQYKFF